MESQHQGRLFLCARCRAQVVLCIHCDRGNRYCSRACWRQARAGAQRAAARRYQHSYRGRMAHAARSRRWRMRRTSANPANASSTALPPNVTHQGSPDQGLDAPLAPCEQALPPEPDTAVTTAAAPRRCRRCGSVLSAFVRQGFSRHSTGSARGSRWPARAHDHGP